MLRRSDGKVQFNFPIGVPNWYNPLEETHLINELVDVVSTTYQHIEWSYFCRYKARVAD